MDPIFAGTLFYVAWPIGSIALGYYVFKLLYCAIKTPTNEKGDWDTSIKIFVTLVAWALLVGFIMLNGMILGKAHEYAPKLPVSIKIK